MGINTTTEILMGRNFYVSNETCTLANTEYMRDLSHTAVKRLFIKPRGGDVRLSFRSGTSGTTFIHIVNGQMFNIDLINSRTAIFYQSPTAGTIVEFLFMD